MTAVSKTKMFHEVRENIDENLGRIYDLRDQYKKHDFLSENRDLHRLFDVASEMLDGLSEEDVLRPYKEFLDKLNRVEAMLNEIKTRCLFN